LGGQIAAATLDLRSSSRLNQAAGSPLLKIGALRLASTGTIDLADSDMLASAATYSEIATYIANARNGGGWDRPGITSSAASADLNHATTLGLLTGAQYKSVNGPTFDGLTVNDTDTLVKFTWTGDANFSGTVNFDDYVRTDIGFNTHLTGWANGDFNYSGAVDFDDYVLIDVAFNTQSGTLGRAVSYLNGDDRSGVGLDDPSVQQIVEHFTDFGLPYAQHFLAAVPEPGAMGLLLPVFAFLGRRRRRLPPPGGAPRISHANVSL
jgi:hypothetical protein